MTEQQVPVTDEELNPEPEVIEAGKAAESDDFVAYVKETPSMQEQMYNNYLTYMHEKGVDEANIMSFDDWKKFFGVN